MSATETRKRAADMPKPGSIVAFDRLAPEYDTLAHGELFTLMRRRTHAVFAQWLYPGCRVLEIGCGTGLDTVFLASNGTRVVACDPSEAMVGRTLHRLAAEGVGHSVRVMPCGLENLSHFLDALGEHEPFDGIVSNFGALNCVECLEPLRALASKLLRPGGVVVLGLIGRSCVVEAIYFALTGRRHLIRRRRREGAVPVPVAGLDVPTFYHRKDDVAATLAPDLALARMTGIGVLVPPIYLEPRWQTFPPLVRITLAEIDRVIAAWPPFNRLGDHVLLQFVKRRPSTPRPFESLRVVRSRVEGRQAQGRSRSLGAGIADA